MSAARIMIALDEPMVLKLSQFMLELEGHDVTIAFGGEDGIGKVADDKYDIAICDAEMPNVPAADFARVCNNRGTRVVVVAASATAEFPDGVLVHGVLQKPYCIQNLYDLVEKVLALRPNPRTRRFDRVPGANQGLVRNEGAPKRRRRISSSSMTVKDAPAEIAVMLIKARRELAAADAGGRLSFTPRAADARRTPAPRFAQPPPPSAAPALARLVEPSSDNIPPWRVPSSSSLPMAPSSAQLSAMPAPTTQAMPAASSSSACTPAVMREKSGRLVHVRLTAEELAQAKAAGALNLTGTRRYQAENIRTAAAGSRQRKAPRLPA